MWKKQMKLVYHLKLKHKKQWLPLTRYQEKGKKTLRNKTGLAISNLNTSTTKNNNFMKTKKKEPNCENKTYK